MKKTSILLALSFTIITLCNAQSNKREMRIGDPADTSIPGLFVVKLFKGADIFTRDPIIRSFEVDSLIEIPRIAFLKQHKDIKAGAILRIKPKPNVRMVDLKEVFAAFNIAGANRDLPITIDGRKASDRNNICASLDAIQSVNINSPGTAINIVIKPEN